jgi:hypothetical protein
MIRTTTEATPSRVNLLFLALALVVLLKNPASFLTLLFRPLVLWVISQS